MLKTTNAMGVRERKRISIFAAMMLSSASFSSRWMKLMRGIEPLHLRTLQFVSLKAQPRGALPQFCQYLLRVCEVRSASKAKRSASKAKVVR